MIVTILTFFANVFIIGSIVYMYQVIFGPIDHHLLMKTMSLFHVRINLENISYAVAGTSVLLVAALAQVPLFHRITMWLYGGRRPIGQEVEVLQMIQKDMQSHTGIDMSQFDWFIKNDDSINAFALGHNRICINTGTIMTLPYDELLGIVAHEMGHIHHKDSAYGFSRFYMNYLGQMCIRVYELFARLILWIQYLRIPVITFIVQIFYLLVTLQILFMQWVIKVPLIITDLFTGRRAEYRADKYAYEIGLGVELHNALVTLDGYSAHGGESGLMSKLYSTHPATEKRIERLRQYVEGK